MGINFFYISLKYHIYAEAGIPEYWLVHLQTGELIIYRQPRGREYGFKMTWEMGKFTPRHFLI